MANKEATVVVVDVGPTMPMLRDPDSKLTRLEKAVEAYRLLLKPKLIAARKTELIGLVLVGTDETRNHLSNPPHFQHVTEAGDLAPADLDALRFCFPTGEQHGDVVAMEMIRRHCRHLKYEKKITVITDAEGYINTSRAEDIAEVFKQEGVEFTVMGMGFDDPEIGLKEEGKSKTKADSEKFILEFTKTVNGVFFHIADALKILDKPLPKRVRPTPLFKGGLILGDPFENPEKAMVIPVVFYSKTTELKTPTSSKWSVMADTSGNSSTSETTHDVNRVTTYKKKPTAGDAMNVVEANPANPDAGDTLDEEVDREDLDKAYMYGRTIVPVRKFDEDILKLKTEKGFLILGFFRREQFERNYLMANVISVMAPKDDEYATRALRAFEQGLFIKGCFALTRYVRTDGSPPKLGVLFSRLPERVGLFWAQVPFAEDVRRYTFASLDRVESRTVPVPHPLAPSKEQVATMRNFVDKLDLMTASVDDEGNPVELLRPRDTFNPAWHRLYQCIQHRALHPDKDLPPVPDLYTNLLEPNSKLFGTVSAECKALQEAFPTKKMETAKSRKGKAGWGGRAEGDAQAEKDAPEVDESRKRIKVDTGAEVAIGADLEAVAENNVRTVTTSEPVKDFEAMMRNREVDLTENAVTQMKDVIRRFVFKGFGDQFHGKALDCVRALRKACATSDESETFNAFLCKLRDDCSSEKDGRSKEDFWDRVVDEKITLISTDEAQDSATSPEDAANFLQKITRRAPEEAGLGEVAEDEEDIMNLLE